MFNRKQAKTHFSELSKNSKTEFIVAYQDILGKLHYFDCSPGLKKIITVNPNTSMDRFIVWGKDEVTINGEILKVDIIPYTWGMVIFLEQSSSFEETIEELGDRASRIHAAFRKLGTALTSIVLLIGSFVIFLRDYIPLPSLNGTKRADSAVSTDLSRLDEILKKGYFHLPFRPNGIFYWRYEVNGCQYRELVASFSPTLKDNVLKGIEIRLTSEPGWRAVFEAHQSRNPHIVRRDSLPPGNPLKIVMMDLAVSKVFTYPVGPWQDNCLVGYVSVGFTQPIPPQSEKAVLEKLRAIASQIEEWERSHS